MNDKGGFFMRLIIFVFSLFLIVGCNNTNTGQNDDREQSNGTDYLYYETDQEKMERLGSQNASPIKDYLQSNEKGIGKDGTERNIFETDEARKIAQELALRDDVKQTQIATTDEQVVVFVLLNDYQDPNIAKSLEEDIKKITPNKKILVYTDKLHWNRLKDIDSSMRARDIGNDLEKFLEENFNIHIKD